MAKLIGRRSLNAIVANLDGVGDALWEEAQDGEDRAAANLAYVRATTPHHKIFGPDHLTYTSAERGDVDSFFSLNAPNALAIEFGHDPSGVFAGTDTKPPEGLYILMKAAGLA
ncbi:tail completion or Neck1 protein [Mycobacterium phage Kimona]|uniref:Head-to-tail connector protein n=1 Tax=Mycobacterium phage Kimona TaxID=2024295 RepID=A0A249XTY5_9CAUD|nr:tail completion or Neck1 protein [Mycobacterium phage Kimona]ASZ75453.1 hypothetical protein PBI_KIMONA_17 [Mycobacterium phage Kimona]